MNAHVLEWHQTFTTSHFLSKFWQVSALELCILTIWSTTMEFRVYFGCNIAFKTLKQTLRFSKCEFVNVWVTCDGCPVETYEVEIVIVLFVDLVSSFQRGNIVPFKQTIDTLKYSVIICNTIQNISNHLRCAMQSKHEETYLHQNSLTNVSNNLER